MTSRKCLVLILCLCLSFVLLGCGGSSRSVVGICLSSTALPIHNAAADTLTEQVARTVLSESVGDAALQLRQAEVYLQEDYSLLLAEPVDPQTGKALAQLAEKQNTPIIFSDFSADHTVAEQVSIASHIGYDPARAGMLLAGLVSSLPGGGDANEDGVISYLLICGPEEDPFHAAVAQSCQGFLFQKALIEKLVCDGSAASANALCGQALAAYGRDVDVIFTTDDAIAQGVLEAVKSRGWTPGADGYVLTVGRQASTQALFEQGELSGLVLPDAAAYSALVVQLAEDLLQETPKTNHVLAPWTIMQ